MRCELVWQEPLASNELAPGDVELWLASVRRAPEEIRRLFRVLSPDERARAERFHFARDRECFVVARGVLRGVIGRYLCRDPAGLEFDYGPYGKPMLKGAGSAGPRFNLSHSGDLVLCGITRDQEIGVDVEQIRRDFDCALVAEHYFSTREIARLKSAVAGRAAEAFFTCWTLKEAYIKGIGKGLSFRLDEWDVSWSGASLEAGLTSDRHGEFVSRWQLQRVPVPAGYAAAIAVEGRVGPVHYWWDADP